MKTLDPAQTIRKAACHDSEFPVAPGHLFFQRRSNLSNMTNVVVIGSQWGDEGKGKIVDWLAHRADIVVRFQGGHNAGHTLTVDGTTYRLSLIPSGVVQGKRSMIGNGVVVDPWALREEIERLNRQGVQITPDNLSIAETASLILPLHRELDQLREKSSISIGTTQRGIGPAYEDRTGRRALRGGDLTNPDALPERLTALLAHHNALRRGEGIAEIDKNRLIADLLDIAPYLTPYLAPVPSLLHEAWRKGQRILFEGAQGVMLDIDHGTWPYVTSSHTVAGQAGPGSGVSPQATGLVLGITKAYTTRVGAGPFPSELHDEVGELLGERGNEFGTNTKRKRRCGWFDAVQVHHATKVAGINGIALTKLDVLDTLAEIRLVVGYRLHGQPLQHFPSGTAQQFAIKPVYETLSGWQCSTRGAKTVTDLPSNAVKYIWRIEQLIEAPVWLISTSPERDDTIVMRDPFHEF